MTFTDWLSALGQVVFSVLTWIGDCFEVLKDNYIVMTFIGILIFSFVLSKVLELISYLRYKRALNRYDLYGNRKDYFTFRRYIDSHPEEEYRLRKGPH